MHADWQTSVALVMVAASAVFLVRRIAEVLRQRGCGGCSGCGATRHARDNSREMIPLEQFQRPAQSRK